MIPRRPPCGCCDCVVASDPFDVDREDAGPKFISEGDGDFYTTGGVLTIDSPADGDFVYRYSPQLFTNIGVRLYHSVTFRVRSSDDGDQIGIIFSLSPVGSFGAPAKSVVLLQVGAAAKVAIFATVTTTLTQLTRWGDVVAPEGEWHELTVCTYEAIPGLGGTVSAAVYLNGELVGNTHFSPFTVATGLPIGGPYCGTITGTPEWDDFSMSRIGDGELITNCPECVHCNDCEFTDDFTPGIDAAWSGSGTGESGRARFGPAEAAKRCVQIPSLEDFEAAFSAKIYWTDDGAEIANPGIRFELGDVTLSLSMVRDPDGGLGWDPPYYRAADGETTPTDIEDPDPAQGDLLTIQVFGEGGGTFTVLWLINGVIAHSTSGLAINLTDVDYLTIWLTPVVTGDAFAEFDDVLYECDPYYGGTGIGGCCGEEFEPPALLHIIYYIDGDPASGELDEELVDDFDGDGWKYTGVEGADNTVIWCTRGETPLDLPGPGPAVTTPSFPVVPLTIHECDPFFATGEVTESGTTYYVEVYE